MTNKLVGRNDDCPCGSGKKFKQCCMQKKKAVGGQALGLRKFTAKVISSGNQPPEEKKELKAESKPFLEYVKLMENSYGEVFDDKSELPPLPESGESYSKDIKQDE